MSNLVNDFEVRKETLRALGGDPTGLANIYEVDLEILKLTGGPGSGAASHDSVDGVNYLTFVAIEDSTIKITKNNISGTYTFEYSTDNAATWNSYTLDTEISLKAGENVKFRGDNPNGLAKWGDMWMDIGPKGFHKFVMTGKIAAYGSIMSLLSPTLSVTEAPYAGFCYLFQNCTPLIKAPELPATKTNNFCYCGLFYGCQNLAVAPELPALILSHRCYMSMFSNCNSLVESPVLPARELANECYRGLFGGCKNLRKITCYSSGGGECDFWHERYLGTGFSKEGTFVKAKGASWGIDSDMSGDGIPYGWSVVEVDVYKEAPMDDKQYARKNAEWTVVEEGLTDAPSDGKTYGRNNGAWTEVQSGYPIKQGVEIDNNVVSVENYGIYTKLNGNFISYESGTGDNYVRLYDKLEVMKDGEKSEANFIDVANAGNGVVKTSNGGKVKFWSGTQQEYDAIATKDANTLYIIK